MADLAKPSDDAVQMAYVEGRQMGLAIGALAISAVAFLSLLGLEKALLALALGYFVMKEARRDSPQQKRAKIAMSVALVYSACFAATLILYHDKISELIRLLQRLG